MATRDTALAIEYPLLIDGGLSNVLEEQGHDLHDRLWTARLLDRDPAAIVRAHFAYLEAGARCITTASYQASLAGFREAGFGDEQAAALILRSVELATQAIRQYLEAGYTGPEPLVAASIGPYGAYLADGSEYRGDYGISDDELRAFHADRFRILDESAADLLAVETIPSLQEARVLAELLSRAGTPAWVSFSCRDAAHINDGSLIRECAALFADHPGIFAIGVNCTAPKYITELIVAIREVAEHKKVVIYPNSGEVYRAATNAWLGLADTAAFGEMAGEWLAAGADIIGGCCRIGPGHIGELNRLLTRDAAGRRT